jgi:annexin A7/11
MDNSDDKEVEILKNLLEKGEFSDITELISKKTQKQRMKLRQTYKKNYEVDLMTDLKSNLAGLYKKIVLALFTDPVEYDVDLIYNSLKNDDSKNILINIFASRPDWYLNKIKNIYLKKYNIELEEHINNDTSDDFNKLLLQILQCKRSKNQAPDIDQCKQLADDLEQEESNNLSIDSPIINSIFMLLSPQELIMVCKEYHKSTERLLTDMVNEKFKGNVKKLLNAILMAKISPSEFFANALHEALADNSFDESIISILISRADVDLNVIKKYYFKLYENDLADDIANKDKNEYINLLVGICNKN